MRDAELTRCFPFVPAAARGEGGFAVVGVGARDSLHAAACPVTRRQASRAIHGVKVTTKAVEEAPFLPCFASCQEVCIGLN